MKFQSLVLLSLISILGFGCADTNGRPNSGGGLVGGGDWDQPSGSFTTQNDVQGIDPDQYGPGCEKAGSPKPIPQIDKRLKPGQVFVHAMSAVTTDDKTISATIQTAVVAVKADSFTTKVKLLAASGVPGFAAGDEMESTCQVGSDGVTCGAIGMMAESINIKNCFVSPDSMKSVSEATKKGSFQPKAGGAGMLAWMSSTKVEGDVKCEGKVYGKGIQTTTGIRTNSLPLHGAGNICGGVNGFLGTMTKDKDGKLIAGFRYELLSFTDVK